MERETVNPQVSLQNLTLDAGIPGDVMWSLIYGKHIVSVPHHDGLFVDRVDICLRRLTEEQRIDSMPERMASSYFGTPQSHAIKDESGAISKGWCARSALSPGFIN